MRLVLDTNVFISAFIYSGRQCRKIFSAWIDGQYELVISDYIIQEFCRIATKKFDFRPHELAPILTLWSQFAFVAEPIEIYIPGVDQSDLPIFGTALSGRAEAIVTGDKALLRVKQIRTVSILSLQACVDLLTTD